MKRLTPYIIAILMGGLPVLMFALTCKAETMTASITAIDPGTMADPDTVVVQIINGVECF